jgi:cytochrome c-type biogenesis protein CcmF
MATLMAVMTFFGVLLAFVASPFERVAVVPADGLGLNPLLYDRGMLYHPPMLLGGYMSWAVPFAFAIGALVTGRLDGEWVRATRRYALVAWAILGVGNLLGAWWAYRVLGWGGYWGWDPVENSAIMPWLLGTAFIHSIMIQERRGMLKVWNMALVLTTFALCLFGTFIVRSGVISSVHSFAQSSIGPYFLAFLSLTVCGSLALVLYRLPLLRSDNQLDSVLSREASFLLNNFLFVALVFSIFWGTIFPVVSEAFQGVRLTVGPPFFNQIAGPIMIALVFLMGVGPLMPWRKASRATLQSNFGPPIAVAACVTLGVLIAVGAQQVMALLATFATTFAASTVAQEFWRGTLARRHATGESNALAFAGLIRRNRRRYGGYIVHLGIVMVAAAVTASTAYQIERQVKLRPGDVVEVGRFRLAYTGLEERREPGVRIVEGRMAIESGDRLVGLLTPDKRFHRNFERQPSSNVAIRTSALEDLYVVLVGWEQDGAASFLIFVNPLVVWLWIGGLVALGGTLVSLWPASRAQPAELARPVRGMATSGA